MDRAIRIFKLELSKPKTIRNLFICMFAFLAFSCITDDISSIPFTFFRFAPYVILISSFSILGVEFESKTDKIMFSSKYTRNEILISKLISVVIKSLIVGLGYIIVNYAINVYLGTTIGDIFSAKQLISIFTSSILYSATITPCIFLSSLLTNNGKVSGILIYILFFDIINALLANALQSSRISRTVAFLLENSPFYVANGGLVYSHYSLIQVVFMLILGVFCLSVSSVLLNRRSI